jgi:DNA-binding MarR family transcriptional regulator
MQPEIESPKYYMCHLCTQAGRKLAAYYNKVLGPLDLTASQVMALGVLWREEHVSLGGFAKSAGMGKAAAVTMIKRLEAMGLVTRATNPVDARLNIISLTGRARALAPEIMQNVARLEQTLEQTVGLENMESLIRGLSLIRDMKI